MTYHVKFYPIMYLNYFLDNRLNNKFAALKYNN